MIRIGYKLNVMKSINVDLDKILKKGSIINELDYERAFIIDRKLRVLVKEHPELTEKRSRLRTILKHYEIYVWTKADITDNKIHESDLAELIAEQERVFLHKRKNLIRKKLQSLSLTQKDLGKILGHKSVTYISELVNGINSFTTHDLIVIHLLLKIDFKDMIPAILDADEREKLALVIHELKKPKLSMNEQSFELIAG